jgi:hypothetical protein
VSGLSIDLNNTATFSFVAAGVLKCEIIQDVKSLSYKTVMPLPSKKATMAPILYLTACTVVYQEINDGNI